MADREALFAAIAHGDDEHRAWLREAVDAHFDGLPIPAPRGSGNKEAKIAEQADRIAALESHLNEAVAYLDRYRLMPAARRDAMRSALTNSPTAPEGE